MGEFNSDDHYLLLWERTPFFLKKKKKKKGVALIVNRRIQNAVLGCNLKNDRMISVHCQGKPLNITVIQVYDLTTDAEEAEVERFYGDL